MNGQGYARRAHAGGGAGTGGLPLAIVVAGGLVAAAFDIAYAGAFWAIRVDLPFQRILQSVAAGVLGDASFAGGAATATLGLALHAMNGVIMALVYLAAVRRWPGLRERAWLGGALYGLLIYLVMNFIVIPLSAAGAGSREPLWVGLTILVHVFLVGIPIAHAVRMAERVRLPRSP